MSSLNQKLVVDLKEIGYIKEREKLS